METSVVIAESVDARVGPRGSLETLSQAEIDKLLDDAGRGSNATLTIDLESQEIRGPDGGMIPFEVDAFRKHCLLNGLDDIGLTRQKGTAIDAYEARAAKSRAWA